MERVNVLKQTDIFYDLTPAQLEMIASICQERTVRAGEVLFQENTPGTEMYAIVRGEIEILLDPSLVGGATTRKGSGPVTIASLREGQTFGEMALVDQGLRSASARGAADNTKLLIIPRQKLLTLCETYPELGYRIMRNMAADMAFKIRNSDLTIREQLLWRPRQAI
jgi:CRP/FNR family transcriptional regulator, cyclic AMP receptor protein